MPCYFPLDSYISKPDHLGKRMVKVMGNKKYVKTDLDGQFKANSILPCGKCVGCRLDYSREWAIRCVLESQQYESNYFITLTYDPKHLPTKKGLGNLNPKHHTKFMKDLRRYYEHHFNHKGIKFFSSGEYGDNTKRPHYHLLIFNLPINDLTIYKRNFQKDMLYNSPTLSKIWKKGHVVIGALNFETSAYVARYVMKKQIGSTDNYIKDNKLNKEFVRMSRNPGIAYNYFMTNYKKMYENDGLHFPTKDGVKFIKPPAYFDRLYTENEDLPSLQDRQIHISKIKERRKAFLDQRDNHIKTHYNIEPSQYLMNEFDVIRKKTRSLKRDGIDSV